jgi:hypothetical protein
MSNDFQQDIIKTAARFSTEYWSVYICIMQCCGSGSKGFVFLRLLDPDPLVRGTDPDPDI